MGGEGTQLVWWAWAGNGENRLAITLSRDPAVTAAFTGTAG